MVIVPVTVHVTYGKQLNIETEFESTLSSKSCSPTIVSDTILTLSVTKCLSASQPRSRITQSEYSNLYDLIKSIRSRQILKQSEFDHTEHYVLNRTICSYSNLS